MSNEIVNVSGDIEVSISAGIPINIGTAVVALGARQLLTVGKIITRAVAEFNHDSEIVIYYYNKRTREAIEFFSVPAIFDAYKMAQRIIDRLELTSSEREKAYQELARKLDKRLELL